MLWLCSGLQDLKRGRMHLCSISAATFYLISYKSLQIKWVSLISNIQCLSKFVQLLRALLMVKTQYMCEISDEILGIFCIPPSPQSFPRTAPKVPNFASSGHAQAGRVHATTKVRRLQSLRPFSGQQGILWCTQNIWTQLKYPFQSEKSFQCMCVFPRSSSPICLLTVIALPIAVTPLY